MVVGIDNVVDDFDEDDDYVVVVNNVEGNCNWDDYKNPFFVYNDDVNAPNYPKCFFFYH